MEVIDFAKCVYEFFNSKQSICESCYCVGLLLNCKTLCLGWIYSLEAVAIICITCHSNQEFSILLTGYIQVFHVILKITIFLYRINRLDILVEKQCALWHVVTEYVIINWIYFGHHIFNNSTYVRFAWADICLEFRCLKHFVLINMINSRII
jgi:hypothetical protein